MAKPKCEHEGCDKDAIWTVHDIPLCHKHCNSRSAILIPKVTAEQAEVLIAKLKAATGC